MWLLWFLVLPCAGVLAAGYALSSALLAREPRAVQAKCLLAEFLAAHEAIPLNEERRERELTQLRAMWSIS